MKLDDVTSEDENISPTKKRRGATIGGKTSTEADSERPIAVIGSKKKKLVVSGTLNI